MPDIPIKPPIGLKPKFIWECERVKDIQEAIKRYLEVDMPIPQEWIDEYNELINK